MEFSSRNSEKSGKVFSLSKTHEKSNIKENFPRKSKKSDYNTIYIFFIRRKIFPQFTKEKNES